RLAIHPVTPAVRAVLLQFHPVRVVSFVLLCMVRPVAALRAREGDDVPISLGHGTPSSALRLRVRRYGLPSLRSGERAFLALRSAFALLRLRFSGATVCLRFALASAPSCLAFRPAFVCP